MNMLTSQSVLTIPAAPSAITKGVPLKELLNENAVSCMADNLSYVSSDFDQAGFIRLATDGLESLSIMNRGRHIARALKQTLPDDYARALEILVSSFLPVGHQDHSGLAVFYYLPFSSFIAEYGIGSDTTEGADFFAVSMQAQYQLTQRFTAEFSIRPFLIKRQDETLSLLYKWTRDPSEDIRRWCSEGTRPRLPWGTNIPSFIRDPAPVLPILESLKNDPSLYVRRSVANNLGDIAKDHPELVFDLCDRWLHKADDNLKWLIRHAVRYYAKKKHPDALELRQRAR